MCECVRVFVLIFSSICRVTLLFLPIPEKLSTAIKQANSVSEPFVFRPKRHLRHSSHVHRPSKEAGVRQKKNDFRVCLPSSNEFAEATPGGTLQFRWSKPTTKRKASSTIE